MELDLIIPCYKAHETLPQTLMSIAIQRHIDNLKVYVINDCDGTDYDEMLDHYRQWLDITYLVTPENVGCGLVRQYGIDHSNQKWIAFIDSDDVLSTPLSLAYIVDEIEKQDADVLISGYFEEQDNGEMREIVGDYTRMHGKVFKRKYLEENNIRFHSNLRLNEDGYFNTLAAKLSNAVCFYNNFFSYIWCNNPKSLTRTGDYLNKYSYMYALGMVDALKILIEHKIPKLDNYIRNVLANFYIYKVSLANSQYHNCREEELYDNYTREFLRLFNVKEVVLDKPDEMMEALQRMVTHLFDKGFKPVWETFVKFLKTYVNFE